MKRQRPGKTQWASRRKRTTPKKTTPRPETPGTTALVAAPGAGNKGGIGSGVGIETIYGNHPGTLTVKGHLSELGTPGTISPARHSVIRKENRAMDKDRDRVRD